MIRLSLLSLLAFSFSQIQAQTKPYVIGLSYETMKLSSLPIKVVEVIDARDSVANIGWIKKVMSKRRRPVTFENEFTLELYTFFRKYIQKNENPRQLVVKVNQLRVSQMSDSKEAIAEMSMELEFFLKRDSNAFYFLARIPCLIRYKGMIEPATHSDNIIKGFKYVFNQLDTLKFDNRIQDRFLVSHTEMETGEDSAGVLRRTHSILEEPPKAGIYADFHEFINNAPGRDDELDIELEPRTDKDWEGTHKVIPYLKMEDRRLEKCWGFSDGKEVYINFDKQYWPIVLENGVAYFFAFHKDHPSVGEVLIGVAVNFAIIAAAGAGMIFYPSSTVEKAVYRIDLFTGRIERVLAENN